MQSINMHNATRKSKCYYFYVKLLEKDKILLSLLQI